MKRLPPTSSITFLSSLGWGETVHLVRRPLTGLLYQPRMIDDDNCGAVGGMRSGRGNRSTRRKLVQVPLRPPQIPHSLGSNPRCRSGKPVTNRLNYGTVSYCSYYNGHAVPYLVEALCYKPEGSGFESRWRGFFFQFINPSSRTMALGSTQSLIALSLIHTLSSSLQHVLSLLSLLCLYRSLSGNGLQRRRFLNFRVHKLTGRRLSHN
jgi:hypothetical protein